MSFLLHPSNVAYDTGKIIGQIVNFSGQKTIHKVSLNLSVNNKNRKTTIIAENGIASFQAANFQRSRDSWTFQPVNHWLGDWQTSGTTIRNIFQEEHFESDEHAVNNAPLLGYDILFPDTGTYDLWCYGFAQNGVFWSFNNDTTNLRSATIGNSLFYGRPRWTKLGTIFIEEGGVYSFDIYLKDNHLVILDQWYFTTNTNFGTELSSEGGGAYLMPLPLTEGPFNTIIRLRDLSESGELITLDNPYLIGNSISSWLPSVDIIDCGKFNYEIRNKREHSGVGFSDGLSLEYWQIGGSSNHFAAWDYIFTKQSVGSIFSSQDFGQNFNSVN